MKQVLLTGLLALGLGHSAYGALGYEFELTGRANAALINPAGALIVTGATSGTASVNLALGVFTFNESGGHYTVSLSIGEALPLLPIGSLDLDPVNTATGAMSDPLEIECSENGITTTFSSWAMAWGGTLASGVGGNVSNTAFQDNENTFFGTQRTLGTIGRFGPSPFSGATAGGVAEATAPYSLSEVITLNGVGPTDDSGDASLAPLPEPAAVALLGATLLLCSSLVRRRRG